MVRSARALTPTKSTSPIMSTKGRKLALCWECERSVCICEKGSDDSVSLCSEDDVRGGVEGADPDLSFISQPPCAPEVPWVEAPSFPHDPLDHPAPCSSSTPLPPAAAPTSTQIPGGQSEVKPPAPEKSVYVSDFWDSSSPDLSVFGVTAISDIEIEPQCSISVETDIVIYGDERVGSNRSLFSFCPLIQNSPVMVHGTRHAITAGGAVYVGHFGPKRLQISITNPGAFCNLFIPKGSSLGVLEIYKHRY